MLKSDASMEAMIVARFEIEEPYGTLTLFS
jgi:hypothetical protein